MSASFRHMLNSVKRPFLSYLKRVGNTDDTGLNWSLAELKQIPEVTLQTEAPCHHLAAPCSINQSCLRGRRGAAPSFPLLLLQALQPYKDSCFLISC